MILCWFKVHDMIILFSKYDYQFAQHVAVEGNEYFGLGLAVSSNKYLKARWMRLGLGSKRLL